MKLDEFRLYNSFKPIQVEQKNYIIFFNGTENIMERKMRVYPSFVNKPWMMNQQDFKRFIQSTRVHYIEKEN